MTYHTMSERSYHGATSRSQNIYNLLYVTLPVILPAYWERDVAT